MRDFMVQQLMTLQQDESRAWFTTAVVRRQVEQSVSLSVSQPVKRLTGHWSWCPPRLAVICDPPGVVWR